MKKLLAFYLLCVMPVPLILGVLSLFGIYPVHINGKLYTGVYPFVVMLVLSIVLSFVMAVVHWIYLKLRKSN